MRVLWIGTLVIGVMGTIAAIMLLQIKQALDVWWTLAGVFSGGMLGLFLLGTLARRAGKVAGMTGVVAGLCVIVWATLSADWVKRGWISEGYQNPFHGFLTIVMGTTAILLVGFVVTMVTGGRSQRGDRAGEDATLSAELTGRPDSVSGKLAKKRAPLQHG